MRQLPYYFVALAALFALLGMGYGMYMAGSADHSLAGAHAHNNLLGWVTTAIYGLYYAVVPAARTRLAVVHLVVTLAGNLVFPIGIGLAIMGQSPAIAAIGGTLQMLSMIIFAYTIWRHRAGLMA